MESISALGPEVDLGVNLGTYLVSKSMVPSKISSIVRDFVSNTVKDQVGKGSDMCVEQFMQSLSTYLDSAAGRTELETITRTVASSVTDSFQEALSSKGLICSTKCAHIGRTIIQGITYSRVLKDSAALTVMCGFVFGDILGWNTLSSGIVIKLIHYVYSCVTSQQPQSLVVEMAGSASAGPLAELLTAVWQAMSIVMGITRAAPRSLGTLVSSLYAGIVASTKANRGVLGFFSVLCSAVRTLYDWLLEYAFGIKPLHRLLYQDKSILDSWVCEVQTLCDPVNEYLVIDNVSWHARLVSAYMVGKFFLREITCSTAKDVPPTLLSLQKSLHLLYVKSLNLGVKSGYRPEPVCLWFSGPPGLGKSYRKDDIVVALLRACGVPTTGNDMFTVNFAQKHWTGAENKAVVYYDDFGTIDAPELLGEGIGQFMQLISDSRFSPPQASLEDKGKPVTPVLVFCNANEDTPVYHGLRDRVAFLRRRHFCIGIVLSDSFRSAFSQEANLETSGAMSWLRRHCTAEDSMPHVRYYFFDPVTGDRKSENLTYEEMLPKLSEKVVLRYDQAQSKYREKLALLTSFTDIEADAPLSEILDLIKDRSVQLSSDIAVVDRLFTTIYSHSKSIILESSMYVKEWFGLLTGGSLSSQAPSEECSCDPTILHHVYLEDNVLMSSLPDEGFGEPFVYACAASECALKTSLFACRLSRLIAVSPVKESEVLLVFSRMLHGLPARTKTLRPVPAVDVCDAAVQTLRGSIPPKTIPVWARNSLVALSGVCLFFSSYKLMRCIGGAWGGDSDVRVSTPRVPLVKPRGALVSQLISSGDNITSRVSGKRVGITRKVLSSQSTSGELSMLAVEGTAQLLPLLDRAICYLVLDGVDRATRVPVVAFTMRIFALAGHWMIMPKHYMAKIQRTDGARLRFVDPRGTLVLDDISFVDTRSLEASELMFVKLPNTVNLFKDLRHFFMGEKESLHLTSVAYAYEREIGSAPVNHSIHIKVNNDVCYRDGDSSYVLPTSFQYAWQGPGRCMTPIYSRLINDKIIGFHVAGGDVSASGKGTPIGCAEPVIRETFECLDVALVAQGPEGFPWLSSTAASAVVLDSNLAELGCVQPKWASQPAVRTSIVPTLVHGYVEPQTRPAPLKPEDVDFKFSPLRSGCEKHGRPPKQFDPILLARAQQALRDQYMTSCKPVRLEVGVMSETDAVVGLDGVDGYQAMELSTSEGFPWTASRPGGETNKRYLFDISADRTSVAFDPALRSRMIANDALRRKGIVPFTVFVDCLKDARIPLSKFEQPGKTRIFSISPADFTVQFRQYFLDILAAQKVNRLSLEHAVGINVHSIEWTLLARKICEVGDSVLCGDYSNFGPGLSSQVVHAVGEVWNDWYKHHELASGVSAGEVAERSLVRSAMFEELRHSVHLCVNSLYQAPCGSPSGAPCTVNINNDVNKLYVYMAWMTCFSDNPLMNNIVAFRKHCRLFVYGDDLICGVGDAVKHKFNNVFLQKFLAEHGIRYTDERKGDGAITPFVSFSEAGFLKGVWVSHPTRSGILTYGLAKSSLEDIANWCRKGPDMEECSRQACCESLMLAYGWGKIYFDEHRARLISAWARLPVVGPLVLYTYEDMDSMRFGWDQGDTLVGNLEEAVERERLWREQCAKENAVAMTLCSLLPADC